MANEIAITQGDSFSLPLRLKDSPTTYHDLTGATMSMLITAIDGTSLTFDNGHFDLDDQTANRGGVTVGLSPAETATLGVGALKEILIRASQNAGADIATWRAPRVLAVYPPSPIDGV